MTPARSNGASAAASWCGSMNGAPTISNGDRRAAAFGEVRAFEQHLARIEADAFEPRHVGRRGNPGAAGFGIEHVAPPAGHRHDCQIGADAKFAVDVSRQLADRQAVPQRDGGAADEAVIGRVEQRPFDDGSADRVGPIEDDDGNPALGAGYRGNAHRPDERIDARAHVLQIDDEDIEPVEHLGGRPPRLAVEADRSARRGLDGVRGLDHVGLLFAPQAVLRRKDRPHLAGKPLGEQLAGVAEAVIDRGLVHEQAEARTAEQVRRLAEAHFQADLDGADLDGRFAHG